MNRGFTLVETLGAVLLLSISLVGPMMIAEKGLQTSLISKDQNSAFNLAQDAVEFVRYARDTNCLAAGHANLVPCPVANWLSGGGIVADTVINLTPCVSADGSAACYFDSAAPSVTPPTACVDSTCSPASPTPTPSLNYDSNNNNLTYTTGTGITPTIFTRTVQIKSSCLSACSAPAEADLTVKVSWSDPIAHSIVVNESLYDWQ